MLPANSVSLKNIWVISLITNKDESSPKVGWMFPISKTPLSLGITEADTVLTVISGYNTTLNLTFTTPPNFTDM